MDTLGVLPRLDEVIALVEGLALPHVPARGYDPAQALQHLQHLRNELIHALPQSMRVSPAGLLLLQRIVAATQESQHSLVHKLDRLIANIRQAVTDFHYASAFLESVGFAARESQCSDIQPPGYLFAVKFKRTRTLSATSFMQVNAAYLEEIPRIMTERAYDIRTLEEAFRHAAAAVDEEGDVTLAARFPSHTNAGKRTHRAIGISSVATHVTTEIIPVLPEALAPVPEVYEYAKDVLTTIPQLADRLIPISTSSENHASARPPKRARLVVADDEEAAPKRQTSGGHMWTAVAEDMLPLVQAICAPRVGDVIISVDGVVPRTVEHARTLLFLPPIEEKPAAKQKGASIHARTRSSGELHARQAEPEYGVILLWRYCNLPARRELLVPLPATFPLNVHALKRFGRGVHVSVNDGQDRILSRAIEAVSTEGVMWQQLLEWLQGVRITQPLVAVDTTSLWVHNALAHFTGQLNAVLAREEDQRNAMSALLSKFGTALQAFALGNSDNAAISAAVFQPQPKRSSVPFHAALRVRSLTGRRVHRAEFVPVSLPTYYQRLSVGEIGDAKGFLPWIIAQLGTPIGSDLPKRRLVRVGDAFHDVSALYDWHTAPDSHVSLGQTGFGKGLQAMRPQLRAVMSNDPTREQPCMACVMRALMDGVVCDSVDDCSKQANSVIEDLKTHKLALPACQSNASMACTLFTNIKRTACVSGHREHSVFCLAYDQNGAAFISGGDDGLIKIWNSDNGILQLTLRGYVDHIAYMALSPDNRFIAACSDDNSEKQYNIRVWAMQDGEPVGVLHGHTAEINNVRFDPTLNVVISVADDGTLRVWDVMDEYVRMFDGEAAVATVETVSSGDDDVVIVANPTSAAPTSSSSRNTSARPTDSREEAVFRHNFQMLLSDATVESSHCCVAKFTNAKALPVRLLSLDIAPSGGILAVGGDDGLIRIVSIASWAGSEGKQTFPLLANGNNARGSATAAADSSQDDVKLSTPLAKQVVLRKIPKVVQEIRCHDSNAYVNHLHFSPLGTHLLSCSYEDGSAYMHTMSADGVSFRKAKKLDVAKAAEEHPAYAKSKCDSFRVHAVAWSCHSSFALLSVMRKRPQEEDVPPYNASPHLWTSFAGLHSINGNVAPMLPHPFGEKPTTAAAVNIPPPLSAYECGKMRFLDPHVQVWGADGNLLRVLRSHAHRIVALAPHPTLPHIALSIGEDGRVVLNDCEQGAKLAVWTIFRSTSEEETTPTHQENNTTTTANIATTNNPSIRRRLLVDDTIDVDDETSPRAQSAAASEDAAECGRDILFRKLFGDEQHEISHVYGVSGTQVEASVVHNRAEHCPLFDVRWRPHSNGSSDDGNVTTEFSVADSDGRIHIFNCKHSTLEKARYHQYLSKDYDELVRDAGNNVIDATTQQPPHLVSQSLCDEQGAEYSNQPAGRGSAPFMPRPMHAGDFIRLQHAAVMEAHLTLFVLHKLQNNGAVNVKPAIMPTTATIATNPFDVAVYRQAGLSEYQIGKAAVMDLLKRAQIALFDTPEPIIDANSAVNKRGRQAKQQTLGGGSSGSDNDGGGDAHDNRAAAMARLRAAQRRVNVMQQQQQQHHTASINAIAAGVGATATAAGGSGTGMRRTGRVNFVSYAEEDSDDSDFDLLPRRTSPGRRNARRNAAFGGAGGVSDDEEASRLARSRRFADSEEEEMSRPIRNRTAITQTTEEVTDFVAIPEAALAHPFFRNGEGEWVPEIEGVTFTERAATLPDGTKIPPKVCGLCNNVMQTMQGAAAECVRGVEGAFLPRPMRVNRSTSVWLHSNCAAMSPAVQIDENNNFKNLRNEYTRGRQLTCALHGCKGRGATIGCTVDTCTRSYHFPCAVLMGWQGWRGLLNGDSVAGVDASSLRRISDALQALGAPATDTLQHSRVHCPTHAASNDIALMPVQQLIARSHRRGEHREGAANASSSRSRLGKRSRSQYREDNDDDDDTTDSNDGHHDGNDEDDDDDDDDDNDADETFSISSDSDEHNTRRRHGSSHHNNPAKRARLQTLAQYSRKQYVRHWLQYSAPPPLLYVPQVGDELVYIPAGHAEFVKDRGLDTKGQQQPFALFAASCPAVLARVETVHARFPTEEEEAMARSAYHSKHSFHNKSAFFVVCDITMRFIGKEDGLSATGAVLWGEPRATRTSALPDLFTVTYCPATDGCPDYLILRSKYEAAAAQTFSVGDKVWVPFLNTDEIHAPGSWQECFAFAPGSWQKSSGDAQDSFASAPVGTPLLNPVVSPANGSVKPSPTAPRRANTRRAQRSVEPQPISTAHPLEPECPVAYGWHEYTPSGATLYVDATKSGRGQAHACDVWDAEFGYGYFDNDIPMLPRYYTRNADNTAYVSQTFEYLQAEIVEVGHRISRQFPNTRWKTLGVKFQGPDNASSDDYYCPWEVEHESSSRIAAASVLAAPHEKTWLTSAAAEEFAAEGITPHPVMTPTLGEDGFFNPQCFTEPWLALSTVTRFDRSPGIPKDTARSIIDALRQLGSDPLNEAFVVPISAADIPEYYRIIPVPLDLALILKRVLFGYYRSLEAYRADVETLYDNCVAFNGSGTPITDQAKVIHDRLMSVSGVVPSAEAAPSAQEQEVTPAPATTTPPTSIPTAPQSRGTATTATTTASPAAPRRPHRHAHKEEWVEDCVSLLSSLQRNRRLHWFAMPVDADILPDYYTIIDEPMDFMTLESLLQEGELPTLQDFANKLALIWENAYKYNKAGPVTEAAEFGKTHSKTKLKEIADAHGVHLQLRRFR